MKKILVVNVNWIGDVIFSAPVYKALKAAYPKAEITALAVPRVAEVLFCMPGVDRIIQVDEQGTHRSPWGKLILIWQLRAQKFDAVFLLHRSLTRALLTYLAGIPIRVGYNIKAKGFLLTHPVPVPDEEMHRSDFYSRVVESFGVMVKDRVCELRIRDEAHQTVARKLIDRELRKDDFLVAVNPGGNWDLKRWPKENFAQLIDHLVQEFQAKVLIIGSRLDFPLAEDITNLAKERAYIFAGQTPLSELTALLARCQLVISADSGPLHLANAVGTSVIGLFGPTRPQITGLRGKGKFLILQKDVGCNTAACYNLQCPNNICMKSISVQDVIDAVREIRL